MSFWGNGILLVSVMPLVLYAWAICKGVSYPKLAWQYVVGDFDNDKDVDFVDFATMGLKWLQADSPLYCGGTDLTGDGLVDLDDLDAFVENWLQSSIVED